VKVFLSRPIEGDWPYLWIDATYVKVRESGRIVSAAVIIAVGVNSDGRREVLGLDIGPSEAEPFWTEFLRKLARRGLRGVKLMISDAHEGIKAAVAKVIHAAWQRCHVGSLKKWPTHPLYAEMSPVMALTSKPALQCDLETSEQAPGCPQSIELLKEAAAKRKDDPELAYYLGEVYHQLKQYTECKEALQRALSLNLSPGLADDARRALADCSEAAPL
jgi:Transposase, Mutator family/Tetratricopeptide repeat